MRSVAVATALLLVGCDASSVDRFARPADSVMLAHRASRYTDDQLRAMQAEGEQLYQSALVKYEARKREEWAAESARLKRCADQVHKLRHPEECGPRIVYPDSTDHAQYMSAEDAFHALLLGPCRFASTRELLKKADCLPEHML